VLKVEFFIKDDRKGHGQCPEDMKREGFSHQAPVSTRQAPTTFQPNFKIEC